MEPQLNPIRLEQVAVYVEGVDMRTVICVISKASQMQHEMIQECNNMYTLSKSWNRVLQFIVHGIKSFTVLEKTKYFYLEETFNVTFDDGGRKMRTTSTASHVGCTAPIESRTAVFVLYFLYLKQIRLASGQRGIHRWE